MSAGGFSRSALPLLLASDEYAPDHEFEPLDRLRLQKGVFLLQMRGPERWRSLYKYTPWDWGPYSRELASEVVHMVESGLLEEEPIGRRRYPRYRTTPEGSDMLAHLGDVSATELEYVRRTRSYVTSRSFSQLLREVYAAYPKYAVASRFQG